MTTKDILSQTITEQDCKDIERKIVFSDVVSQGIEIGRQQIIKTIEGRIEFLEQEQSERKARGVNLRYANHTRTCNILREFVKDLKRIYDCSTPKEVSEG